MAGKSTTEVDANIIKIRPDEIKQVIKGFGPELAIGVFGPPGVGKSTAIAECAEELDFMFVDIRLSMMAPPDIRGIPVPIVSEAVTKWFQPDFFPTEEKIKRAGKKGCIICLDELTSAQPAIQVAAQQLILDRKVGEFVLPPKDVCYLVAAGNRIQDKAVAFKMPAPVADRLINFTIEPSVEHWREYEMQHGGHPIVLGFHNSVGIRLLAPPYDTESSGYAFPTPRSWHAVSTIMHRWEKSHKTDFDGEPISDSIRNAAIYGSVGAAAGAEFLTFVEAAIDLPDVDAMLNGKDKLPPKEYFHNQLGPAVMYTFTAALSSKTDEKNLERFIQIVRLMPKENGVIAYTDVVKRRVKGILSNKEAREFNEEISPYTRFK